MKTKFGNYELTADRHQFILTEIGVTEKGTEKRTPTYHPRLEQVMDKLFHLELAKSDAETLRDIEKVVNATRRLVKTAGFTREDF